MASAPLRLRTEFNSDPKGIVVPRPRLSWWVNDPRPAEVQTAYHIVAASSEVALKSDIADMWDSGIVEGSATAHVAYAGRSLQAGQRVWWRVKTFDSDGVGSPWSDPAYFEMSPVNGESWTGRWIAAPLYGSHARGVQIPALRREFVLDRLPREARLVIACLGDYRVEVNGKRLVESPCSPVWASYAHETYYQTCDVTALLQVGANSLAVLLADGIYSGFVPGRGRGNSGDRPMLLAQLHLRDAKGEETIVATDHQWRWRASWILGSEFNAGEHVDGRQHVSSWSQADGEEQYWSSVDVADNRIDPVSQFFPLDRVQQVLRPEKKPVHIDAIANDPLQWSHRERVTVQYDFGNQIVGRCHIRLRSLRCDSIELRYSLDDTFTVTTHDTYTSHAMSSAASEAARATDETSPSEVGSEHFEAEFALHSFRFLQVTYTQELTDVEDLYALRIALSDVANLDFRCDHPSINRLFDVVQNSLRGVAQYAPWQGVTPAEREPDVNYLGCWIDLFIQQGNHAIAKKWLSDIVVLLGDTERPPTTSGVTVGEGADRHNDPLPSAHSNPVTAPGKTSADATNSAESTTQVTSMGTSSPDAAAATALGTVLDVWPNDGRGVVPLIDVVGALETLVHGVWALYRYFDERDFLRECYPVLRALAFASSEREQGLLRDRFDTRLCGEGLSGTVVATANLFGAMKVLGRIAGVLTHLADYEHIEARADEMKKAFRLRFLTQSGHFAIDSQSAFVAALHHGLLEAGESTLAQNRLIELIEKANYHCDVAPAVVGAVLPTLTQAGRLDLAYMLLLQTSEPSWLHNVEAGYQLVGRHPQQFDIAQAGILRWIVESMVGLSLDDDYSRTGNGFRKVRVRPRPPLGRLFQAGAPIQSVEASLNTVNGRFTVSWRMAEDSFEVNLVVPPNCQASVTLPDDIEQQVRSGTHQFTMRFDAGGDGIPILLDRDGVNERRA